MSESKAAPIRRGDFLQWLQDPVTKEVHKLIQEHIDNTRALMCSKRVVSEMNGHLRLNELMGEINALQKVLDLSVEDEEEKENEEM